MVGRLETAAALPVTLKLKVVRRKEANAMALPGGYIYVFEGLIKDAISPDEVGGVIAHEIGHVAHRDGMRSVLQAGGLAFVFGLVLGDFVGGGAIIIAAKTVLQLRYSREVEADADRFAVDLMEKAGADARALGVILMRIAGETENGIKILANHPATKERAVWIETAARSKTHAPLLDEAGWAALRRICSAP
jgi:Zn-dependent protease with chaperone function